MSTGEVCQLVLMGVRRESERPVFHMLDCRRSPLSEYELSGSKELSIQWNWLFADEVDFEQVEVAGNSTGHSVVEISD